MLKLGITKKEQLTTDNLVGFFKKRKFIAQDLYNSLDDVPPPERDEIQERMLSRFAVNNGTFKLTNARRFDDFDRMCVSAISARFSRRRYIRVHDIGASDGRTSCALYNDLNQLYGERLDFLASDFAPYLYVLKRPHSTRRLIIDEQGQLLQIITPPFVFNVVVPESMKLYPLNHLLRRLMDRFYARPLLKGYKAGRLDIQRERLELLCWECRARIARANNFHFERYDVLSSAYSRFDIIRVMNVLNYSYFTEAQLRKAVENIFGSLNEGGMFITGSNSERGTTVNGGIYLKNGDCIEKLERSGKGSQVEALITT